jgi:hypothetical protein
MRLAPTQPTRRALAGLGCAALLLAAALGLPACGIPATPPPPAGTPEPAPAAAPAAPAQPALEATATPGPADLLNAPPPPQNPEDAGALEQTLLDQWDQLAEAGQAALDVNAAVDIAMALRTRGPRGVQPLLDTLGEDPGNPVGKMLVVIALTHLVAPEDEARLIELTAPGVETTGRACAATLLSYLDTPAARERTAALLEDPNRRVRVATVIALLMAEDELAMTHLDKTLADPETTTAERQQILLAMPDSMVADHLGVFAEAAVNPELADPARMRAIDMLGQLGTAEHLPLLDRLVESEPGDSALGSMATLARDAIRARAGQ